MQSIVLAISDSNVGGGQTYLLNLARSLKETNLAVLCPDGNLSYALNKEGIRVINIEFNLRNIVKLRKILFDEKVTLINSHLLGTTFWIVMASILNPKIKVICTLLNPIIYENINLIKRITFPFLIKYISFRVQKFICVSNAIKESLKKYSHKPSYYLPSSVNILKFPNINNHDTIKSRYKIGIFGRISYAKGHLFFIQAAKLILEDRNDVEFYVIGEGELKQEIITYIANKGLTDNVTFTGFVDDSVSFLSTMDIIIMPSIFEGIPFALLEVMAMGLPVVASNIGGIPDVITDQVDGLIVPVGDVKAIKNSVIRLLEDREFACYLGGNARLKVSKHFDLNNMKHRYLEIIKEMS